MTFRSICLAATACACVSLSAPAWAIADQDNSASSQAQARAAAAQHQNAYGGQAKATGGNGGAGGAGGQSNVHVTVKQNYQGGGDPPAAAAGAADPSSGYSGYRGSVVAPAITLAPASGTGCGSVGLGAGGSGLTGAGVITYTWEMPNCTAMQYYAMLTATGHPLVAEYVLINGYDKATIRKGFEWEAQMNARVPAQPVAVKQEDFLDGFCAENAQACD